MTLSTDKKKGRQVAVRSVGNRGITQGPFEPGDRGNRVGHSMDDNPPNTHVPKKRKQDDTEASIPQRLASRGKTLHSFFNSRTLSQIDRQQLSANHQNRSFETRKGDALDLDDDGIEEAYSPAEPGAADSSRHAAPNVSTAKVQKESALLMKGSEQGADNRVATRVEPAQLSNDAWTESFAPTSLQELAVNKKKIAEVDGWLADALAGHPYRRLLVMRGPTGCGKTATVKLLSQTKQVEIAEWSGPAHNTYGAEGYSSITEQFHDFLNRGEFPSLALVQQDSDNLRPTSGSHRQKHVLLIEEFPIQSRNAHRALESIRKTLLVHLEGQSVTPVIFIFSEDGGTQVDGGDSLSSYQLLGPDLMHHPCTAVIEFNKIAPTFLVKALELIVKKLAISSGRKVSISKEALISLAGGGDIRSSLGMLQMAYMNYRQFPLRLQGRPKQGGASEASESRPAFGKAQFEASAFRDSGLGLFHAIGKVVYNKREAAEPCQPPSYLDASHRPLATDVNIGSLYDTIGADLDLFLPSLQENYVVSCSSEEALPCIEAISEGLSLADMLDTIHLRGLGKSSAFWGSMTSSELLQHREMVFHSTVRGILFHLPYPVNRHIVGGSGPLQKISYPSFIKSRKKELETQSLLGRWLCPSQRLDNKTTEGFLGHHSAYVPMNLRSDSLSAGTSCEGPLTRLNCTEMVLTQLPYQEKTRFLRDSSYRSPVSEVLDFENSVSGHGLQVQSQARSAVDAQPVSVPKRNDLLLSDDDIEDG